jgi:hypothetical protein
MPLLAVITGDLVNSTGVAQPDAFRHQLNESLAFMKECYGANTSVYRGDGFQLTIPNATDAYEVVLQIRARLIAASPGSTERWDARIAIALGMSSGVKVGQNSTVHVNSGRCLDNLGKNRLGVIVGKNMVGFQTATALAALFIDDIVNGWTAREAEILSDYLSHRDSQQKIANRLGVSRPTVTLTLQRAKANLVDAYIRDMTTLTEMAYGKHPD